MKGRVGGRVGARNTGQPSASAADGVWGLQEAYDALWRSSWPISWTAGFGVANPSSVNASCQLSANLSASGSRSTAWGDPISFEWQRSESNSNTPNTGNPWLAEHLSHNGNAYRLPNETWMGRSALNPSDVYSVGLAPSPLVRMAYASTASSDSLFSQVTLLASFDDGAFDRSNDKREFFIRRGGLLSSTVRRVAGTRSFTNGSVSYYGDLQLSGNFCIEGWFYFDSTATRRQLFSLGTISDAGNFVQLSLNENYFEYQRFGSQPVVLSSTIVDSQEWVHVALVRSGSTVRLYVNGINDGETTDSGVVGDSLLRGNVILYARANDYVDEFRVTRSSRYAANFTPGTFHSGGNSPQVIVSGGGSVLANGTYSAKATGDASWDSKQFYVNSDNNCCIFWEASRGIWAITPGSLSGPSGERDSGYSGRFLYISDGSCWTPVSETDRLYGPPSQTLSRTGLTFLDNETYYRLKAVSGLNEAASRTAKITVEPISVAFTQQPTDQFAVSGSATFSATVAGTGQMTADSYTGFLYQWQKRGPGSSGPFTDINGANSTSVSPAGLSDSDNGSQFRLRATTSCSSGTVVFSRIAILYVGSPREPTNLVGIPGDSQVGLTWSAPTNPGSASISDYVVQYSSNGGVTWTTFSDGTGTATSATVTGLTNGTGYIFRVAAANSIGAGPYCTPTPRLVPSPAGTDPYFSYVSFVSNFDGDNNSTAFADQSLAAREVLRFGDTKISTTESKWGSAAYFDGTGDYLKVSDPSAFRIGNQDFTVEAWIYPTSVGSVRAFATTADPTDHSGFWLGINSNGKAYWRLGNSGSWATDRDANTLSTNQWYHVAICRSGGVARLYVDGVQRDSVSNSTNISNINEAFLIGGRTIGSQFFQGYIGGMRFTKGIDRYPLGVTFAVPAAPFPVSVVGATAPNAPTLVSAIPGTRQAAISWFAPSNNGSGIRDYLVQYSIDGGVTWTNFSDGTNRSTTATVTGLSDDTAYVFRVAAVNYIGTGPYSTASSPVSTNALPGAPTGVSGTRGNGEVAVSWSPPSSTGGAAISDYAVQFSGDSGATWTTFTDGTSSSATATVTGLTNGSPYVFRVAAVTAVGTGPYSTASSSVSPLSSVPGAPTALSGVSGNQQVSLSWASPANNGGSPITGYVVEYRPAGGAATTVSTGSSAASYVVTGLTNGTAYTFRVSATNSVGTGAYSSSTSPITPSAFTPMAVMLTSGSSYTVPAGATSMKAWAVGAGSMNAGAVCFKTWTVSGGTTASYSLGSWDYMTEESSQPCTLTYDGTTISAGNGASYSSFSGGDGGAAGGVWQNALDANFGGAVGGNSASLSSCNRRPATDVSGLLAAVALAGRKTVEDCGDPAAFGSGGWSDGGSEYHPGFGGGAWDYYTQTGPPAVVLYFT